MVLTSRKNAWKKISIFPLRYYANCVSTTVTVLVRVTLKVSISFIVALYIACLGIYNIQENKFPLHRNHPNTITKFSMLVFTLDIVAVYSDK